MVKLQPGSVVLSKSGRDSGRYYIVTGIIDEQYVTIADGTLRKIEKPKKKKVKHLKPNGDVLEKLSAKLINGDTIYNAEIKSALRIYNDKL
ncbi:MAG: RNA-binding protein [Christensenellales bacterium]|jgi:large subunit ribosomal protein L14e